ncbi:MAG: hypothetical protein IJM71_04915 [Clostridia bacterium]|nr:hypothetical protein [Clostridia bacterium]
MKRKYSVQYKKIDKICLVVIGVLFFAFVIVNLFGMIFLRQERSEREKRDLAKFPELSFSSLFDGSFSSGLTGFFSDHLVFRDGMIDISKKVDSMYGVNFTLGDSSLVIIDGGQNSGDDKKDELNGLIDKITNPETDPVETDEPEPDLGTLSLSKKSIKLAVGSSTTIFLNGLEADAEVKWSVDPSGTLELVSSDNSKVNIKATVEGTGTVACRVGDEELTCSVSVEKLEVKENGEVDVVFQNGFFIYDGAVYTPGFYSPENFSSLADVGVYYKNLFGADRMTILVGPTSGVMLDNDELRDILIDYKWAYESMNSICASKGLNCPDTREMIQAHRDEYLYYKTDHHWTDRGAYYAYAAFAKSIGLEPTPLENFKVEILSETYQGSMYDYTQNEMVKSFFDTVEAYMPTKPQTMTIQNKQGEYQTYDSSIMTWSDTYAAFLCGDNPYTVINVPENPQDLNILVLKDSFGNAFIPFLSENYGNIYVVDTRYSAFNIKDLLGDIHFTDILFVNNLEAACSPAWPTLYLKAVGVY